MEFLYFSQYSFARFTPTIVLLYIALFFLLKKDASKTSKLLAGYFFLVMLYNLGHFICYSFYHPLGALGWYLTALAPVALSFQMQFAYHFPRQNFKKEARIVWIITLLLAISGFLHFIMTTFNGNFLSNEQHYNTSLPSQILPPLGLLYYLWTISIFFRQSLYSTRANRKNKSFLQKLKIIFLPPDREARAALSFSIIVFMEVVHILLLVLFHNFEALDFSALNYGINTAFLIIAFLYVIIYINNSPEQITFLVRIIGISLISLLFFISFIGHFTLHWQDQAYNQEKKILLKTILLQKDNLSAIKKHKEIDFILRYQDLSKYDVFYQRNQSLIFPEKIRFWTKPPTIKQILTKINSDQALVFSSSVNITDQRLFLQIKEKNYYAFKTRDSSNHFIIGFNYLAYRQKIHDAAAMLILVIFISSLIILFIFPLLLYKGLLNPLNNLLQTVKKVNQGNLSAFAPISFHDEIGYLSGSFNKMIISIKDSKQQLEEHALNLEEKVANRTEELSAAMEEMQAINEQLIETRDELWGEMQLAKKIQTALLPKNPSLPHYDIAVYLEPANEIGGDFYDIIEAGNLHWFVIGDVSGHGVPAGLIMMMTQTAIHAVLAENPHAKPAVLLNRINHVITENIRRLQEDKYITITVLAADSKGVFRFAGLHQDILLYRSASQQVECVETDGFWIGIEDNVKDYIMENSFILYPEDTMILFTDGISEAYLANTVAKPDNQTEIFMPKMFGNEGIVRILAQNGQREAKEIKTAILNEMSMYESDDDKTLVIIKRLK